MTSDGDQEYLEGAITHNHEGHSDRFMSLNNLAINVFDRYWESGRTEDLEEAITSYREAVAVCPLDHPDRCMTLNTLANLVFTHYQKFGGMEDLEEAITSHREALALRPVGHPNRSTSLNNLAIAVHILYEQLGRMEDLDEAITYNCEALALCPLGHPKRSMSLNNLANALLTRCRRSGRMEDLEEVIMYYREALTLHPLGHPNRSSSLNNLANAVLTRCRRTGRMEDLEEVIMYYREALTLHPLGHPNRSSSLNNLANAVLACYAQSGRIEDLEEAITSYREALTIGYSDRSMSLYSLATVVFMHYEQLGSMEDLEEAITMHREALTLRPLNHPNHSSSLNNLATAVLTRYEKLGSMEDLEEAITCNRKALTHQPLGHPDRSGSLVNLSHAVHTRYDQLGKMEDLEEAITSCREALTLGYRDRPISLNNLANALLARYKQLGSTEDLEEVIRYHREALTLRPLGHPHRSGSLNNLATAVLACYMKSGGMEDLEEAITYHREALSLRPLGHPDRSESFNNLAHAVLARYEQLGRVEDLEEVISSHREVLTLRPLGHPGRPNALNHLANALIRHYEHLGRIEDLDEALTCSREALPLRPLGHPYISDSLRDLADVVLTCYRQSGRMEDLEESFMLYEQAVNQLAASSMQRLEAAIRWANMAQLHHHSSVIHAYSMALYFLNRCLISYPNIDSQQRFLATVQIPKSLASDAASAAISQNNLEAAVELLDQGRAILWSKMAGYRFSFDQLRQVDEQLADKLEMLNGQLECLSLSGGSMYSKNPTSSAHFDAQMQRSRILSEEWEETVGQIRKLQDFSNFLQAVPFATLRTAAAEGPIIIINISNHRSDAIILHIDNPPILVTLPDIQPKHLTFLAKKLAFATEPGAVTDSRQLIVPILRDLWNDIVSPVCDCLRKLAVPEKSRIWWCPTSQLCGLPLHAAGPYLPKQKNLPDIYTSSYIPTLSTLIKARSHTVDQSIVPKLLVIGQPKTLPKVRDELDNLRQLGGFVDIIVDADADRDAALRGLQQHTWAHFACHGHLGDNTQPFHASFELHGGSRLTLLDLIQARLPNAELAFLSACHAAAGDSSTPDETIHLAAALQFCGFRSVVGTLWEISDEDGPIISKEFYKYMFRKPGNMVDFRDSAEALNLAIRVMRKSRVPLERWIMFVHIGA